VYFGCGGPLAEAGAQAEIDPFLRRCETNGEIAPAVRWRFEPGYAQACNRSLSVQVRLLADRLGQMHASELTFSARVSACAARPAAWRTV
jgi:hypothetical protein